MQSFYKALVELCIELRIWLTPKLVYKAPREALYKAPNLL